MARGRGWPGREARAAAARLPFPTPAWKARARAGSDAAAGLEPPPPRLNFESRHFQISQALLELSSTSPDAGAGAAGGGAAAAPDKWVARLAGRKPATAGEVDAAVGRLAGVLAGHGIRLQLDRCAAAQRRAGRAARGPSLC